MPLNLLPLRRSEVSLGVYWADSYFVIYSIIGTITSCWLLLYLNSLGGIIIYGTV